MLADEGVRALLQPERAVFLNPDLRSLGMSAVGREHRDVGVDPKRIVSPMTGCDHPRVKVEDAREFLTVECRDWAPIPRRRERRDDAQALFAFGCG